MFLATMFAKSQPYTDRFFAERSLALYISNRNMFTDSHPSIRDQFRHAMAHEQYGAALGAWNEYVRKVFNGNTLYMASVSECECNRPFS